MKLSIKLIALYIILYIYNIIIFAFGVEMIVK